MYYHKPALAAAPACADFIFRACDYIAIRPIIEAGDYVLDATVDQYDKVQIQAGLPKVPTHLHSTTDDLAKALDMAFLLKHEFADLALWYNGLETQAEFYDWRSFAALCAGWDEDWELVEQAATGSLDVTSPNAIKVITDRSIIAAAIMAVL